MIAINEPLEEGDACLAHLVRHRQQSGHWNVKSQTSKPAVRSHRADDWDRTDLVGSNGLCCHPIAQPAIAK